MPSVHNLKKFFGGAELPASRDTLRAAMLRIFPRVRLAYVTYSTRASTDANLTGEQKERLREMMPEIRSDDALEAPRPSPSTSEEMDAIRARGFLKFCYTFKPPANLMDLVRSILVKNGVNAANDWSLAKFDGLEQKTRVLNELGAELKHYVPNSRLHKIKSARDLFEFYSEPVNNLTEYAEMARDAEKPENLAVVEHAIRFHPNDKEAPHGGITAYPGEGGKVFSLRQKRLLRQFKPKKEWYDYEDQTFDYTPVDEGMPWDPTVAKKMDRYVHKKFFIDSVKKVPQP